jgi:endonuclease G
MNMRTLFLLLSMLLIGLNTNAQDLIKIKHTNYTTTFSKSKKYPVMVEWWLTKSMIDCSTPLKRKDNFKPDPQLIKETNISKDYVGSGLDRGHMMPAAENLCQSPSIQDECFYFSNMSPQYHSLNAGDWKSVEILEREITSKQDSIHIWCGNIGESKKIGGVSVPTFCWKVIYIKRTNVFKSFLFPNDSSHPDGYKNNQVDISVIKKLTGLKFVK